MYYADTHSLSTPTCPSSRFPPLYFRGSVNLYLSCWRLNSPLPNPLPVVIIHPFSSKPHPSLWLSSTPAAGSQIHPSPFRGHPPTLMAWQSNSPLSTQQSSFTPAGNQPHSSPPGGHIPSLHGDQLHPITLCHECQEHFECRGHSECCECHECCEFHECCE